MIPRNRINPIARKIVDSFPKPNTKSGNVRYSRENFFVAGGDNIAKDDFYNLAIKIDHNFGDKPRAFFRHASNDRTEFRSGNGIFGTAEDGPLPLKRINDACVIDVVSTLQPTLIFNWRVSFNRYVAGASGVWKHLISGWENPSILRWYSGNPWDLNDNLTFSTTAARKSTGPKPSCAGSGNASPAGTTTEPSPHSSSPSPLDAASTSPSTTS